MINVVPLTFYELKLTALNSENLPEDYFSNEERVLDFLFDTPEDKTSSHYVNISEKKVDNNKVEVQGILVTALQDNVNQRKSPDNQPNINDVVKAIKNIIKSW